MPLYWEEAIAHAEEAHQQEVLGNHEIAFAMYKTAIVCLLSGVQGDTNSEHRIKVKEQTSQYLMQAEWIYNNHLVFQRKEPESNTARIPWRSRSQMKRYKVVDVTHDNLLVQDVTDDVLVLVKGVLKSSCPLDRSERCILPKDVPFMVKLYGLHETETTVYFVLEHIRYGRLWDHLQHYFSPGIISDNVESEVTCISPNNEDNDASDNSISSNGSSTSLYDYTLSRLASSVSTTDTLSRESLSSHDENYFDLVEDYARAKSQKLKEIQDFNERRKHMESLRPVTKTVSQVDLKALDDERHYRSQSLTDLPHDDLEPNVYSVLDHRSDTDLDTNEYSLYGEQVEKEDASSFEDIDTQQLLRNAQRLIESINETLSKTENVSNQLETSDTNIKNDDDRNNLDISNSNQNSSVMKLEINEVISQDDVQIEKQDTVVTKTETTVQMYNKIEEEVLGSIPDISQLPVKDLCSPVSDSIPSITEEYSTTAVFQRKSLTSEMVMKWAAQLLVALDILHQNGIICRDLNPDNILLSDDGSIRLTYFFRYPNIDPSLNFSAKEKLYVAPEVTTFSNTHSNVTFAADWWSYGAIIYELITLQSLHHNHPAGIHSHTILTIPDKIPVESQSLLRELLKYDSNERLGSGISGADDIKSHPYFAGINWEEM